MKMRRPTVSELVETLNAFCPTGKDGGKDNSCGAGKGTDDRLLPPSKSLVTADGVEQLNGPPPSKESDKALANLSKAEKTSITLWGESSGNVKMGLYPEWESGGSEDTSADPKVTAKNFLSAMAKLPDYEGTVYRGVGEEGAEGLVGSLKKGGTFVDKLGPNSASRFPRMALTAAGGGIVLRIKVKTGKSIENANGVPSEEGEVVTMSSKYRVVGKKDVSFSATGLPDGYLKNRLSTKKFTVIDLEEIG